MVWLIEDRTLLELNHPKLQYDKFVGNKFHDRPNSKEIKQKY